MKIETKFNVGDEVWFIRHNKITKGEISIVHTSSDGSLTNTSYQIRMSSSPADYFELYENEYFATKEELIKSL